MKGTVVWNMLGGIQGKDPAHEDLKYIKKLLVSFKQGRELIIVYF